MNDILFAKDIYQCRSDIETNFTRSSWQGFIGIEYINTRGLSIYIDWSGVHISYGDVIFGSV